MLKLTDYLTVSGVKLEVRRSAGAADTPTLIFLHEGLGCVDMWRDFPEKISRLTGCPALVYSRQGYGRSDPCALPRPLRYMHDEALDILPQLLVEADIEDHIIIGHSDGASIALIYAGSKNRTGLRGVITMAPHIFCEELSVRSIALARQAFLQGELRSRLARYHHDNTDCAFWGWNDIWLAPEFIAWNIEEYLPEIKIPQLILQGEDDQYGTIAQVKTIKQLASGPIEISMIAACGHSPYKEQETQSLADITGFLRTLI